MPLAGKKPILVTAFADVFLLNEEGVWLLDSLEGRLKRAFTTREELQQALSTQEGQDHYLFSPFVDRAIREDGALAEAQCLDFKIHPVMGGSVAYENVERRDFAVALNIRGQIHDQVRHLKPGTKISGVKMSESKTSKPWWKVW